MKPNDYVTVSSESHHRYGYHGRVLQVNNNLIQVALSATTRVFHINELTPSIQPKCGMLVQTHDGKRGQIRTVYPDHCKLVMENGYRATYAVFNLEPVESTS